MDFFVFLTARTTTMQKPIARVVPAELVNQLAAEGYKDILDLGQCDKLSCEHKDGVWNFSIHSPCGEWVFKVGDTDKSIQQIASVVRGWMVARKAGPTDETTALAFNDDDHGTVRINVIYYEDI